MTDTSFVPARALAVAVILTGGVSCSYDLDALRGHPSDAGIEPGRPMKSPSHKLANCVRTFGGSRFRSIVACVLTVGTIRAFGQPLDQTTLQRTVACFDSHVGSLSPIPVVRGLIPWCVISAARLWLKLHRGYAACDGRANRRPVTIR